MKVEDFDRLFCSDDKFDVDTAHFVATIGSVMENWHLGNVVKAYGFIWHNPILAEMAEKQCADECLDDWDDDVDETFYNPYAGCEIWDNCNYEW